VVQQLVSLADCSECGKCRNDTESAPEMQSMHTGDGGLS